MTALTPADRDLRERCLKLALENVTADAKTVVGHARVFCAFVTGESDKTEEAGAK